MRSRILLTLMTVAALVCAARADDARPLLVGTLQSSVDRIAQNRDAGITIATVDVTWDRFQPAADRFDDAYGLATKQKIAAFKQAGQRVSLDLGLQYPPDWVRALPNALYVNQYGQPFDGGKPGARVVNGVFNQAIRDLQAAYVAKVFEQIAADADYVRLGWNYFGELGYPAARYRDRSTCFWAFDDIARGRSGTRPAGISPCPVEPPSLVNAPDAARFMEWYLDALANYQSWQIKTVRQHTKAKLVLLYGSWGIRPGTVQKQLLDAGQTELSLGYDFDRLIKSIKDDNVAVCTTWIDADPKFGNDEAADESRWSPVHFIADRCAKRQPPLEAWAENTGNAGPTEAALAVQRARHYKLSALVWAFEPQLYDEKKTRVSIEQFRQLIHLGPEAR